MPRELHSHKVNGCNEAITVEAIDEPGSGGAHHRYRIDGPTTRYEGVGVFPAFRCEIRFQNGPIKEAGVNGITHEALIAIVIDRLQGFQRGPFACHENAIALTKLEEAQHWLKHRTNERLARGVEGTHEK